MPPVGQRGTREPPQGKGPKEIFHGSHRLKTYGDTRRKAGGSGALIRADRGCLRARPAGSAGYPAEGWVAEFRGQRREALGRVRDVSASKRRMWLRLESPAPNGNYFCKMLYLSMIYATPSVAVHPDIVSGLDLLPWLPRCPNHKGSRTLSP